MPKIIKDESVFRAVIQTIIERGYTGSTTKMLADAAEVSEVTLFRRYGSKLQLVKRAISYIIEMSDFTSAVQYTGDLKADLVRITKAYQDSAVKHGFFFYALYAEISKSPELADSLDDPKRIFHEIGRLFVRYQADGLLRQEHPSHAVAALLGPIIYLGLMKDTMLERNLPELNLPSFVERFLEGRLFSLG